MKADKKKIKLVIIAVGCLIILIPFLWLLVVRLEGQEPLLEVNLVSPYIGSSTEITINGADTDSGLRSIWVGLLQNGKETVLYDADFPSAGFLRGGKTHETSAVIPIAPRKLGFADGEAMLRMVARDYSWRDWWSGNKLYIEKKVVIDTRPPVIEVLSRAHNISQGGAGLVIFRSSETCSSCGVQVGDKFFPGHGGFFDDPRVYLAFVALGYKQSPDSAIFVKATDQAGNSVKSGLNYYIRRKVFRKDRINISDRFLNQKMPEFSAYIPQDATNSPVEKFLSINRDLRQENYRTIVSKCQSTDKKMHWQGVFLRLPKSASRARFADHRTYTYKKKEIDRQVHMGIDLASISRSPVPVANAGLVIFSENLGIYGNTVIVDHGFGLFSMYSHLSQITVKPGDLLSKGDILGRTGSTGMAGGDHLHFSMLINDIFVNPVEWWDKKWIENNVLSKIEQAKSIIKQN